MARARAATAAAPADPREQVAPWYRPHAGQRRLHAARDSRFVTVCAGRRSGKTLSCAVEFVDRVFTDAASGRGRTPRNPEMPPFLREPSAVYWVVAPQSSLHAVALRHVLRALPECVRLAFNSGTAIGGDAAFDAAIQRSPIPRLWLPGGALVEFRSGEHPEDLVSEGLDGLWITEAARLKPAAWEGNLRPALAERRGWVLTDSTPLGRNWWWSEFWRRGADGDDRHDLEYRNLRWTSLDNHPPPGVVNAEWTRESENLRREVEWARKNMTAVTFRREYEASFEAFVGQVYAIDEARHVFAGPMAPGVGPDGKPHRAGEPGAYRRFFAGFDWGRAAPAALVIVGERGPRAYDVVAEVYEAGRLASTWAETMRRVAREWGVRAIYCDPSTPILPDLRNAGLPVLEARERDVLRGIEVMAGLLGAEAADRRPGLRVHASCGNLLREMGGYRWREMPGGGAGDEPVKRDDHACFPAATMVETRRGPVAINRVRVGDEVLTRAGFRAVLASGMTRRRAQLWRVALDDGGSLTATAGHPVWTGLGFFRFEDLCRGDALTVLPRMKAARIVSRGAHAVVERDPTPIRVASPPCPAGSGDVFNLTVEGEPEFYADGVLVHNCDAVRYAIASEERGPSVWAMR